MYIYIFIDIYYTWYLHIHIAFKTSFYPSYPFCLALQKNIGRFGKKRYIVKKPDDPVESIARVEINVTWFLQREACPASAWFHARIEKGLRKDGFFTWIIPFTKWKWITSISTYKP